MNGASRKMLTIVTESSIEARVVKDLKQLGARGYTVTESRGEGSRGVRRGDWDLNRNVTIQVVCEKPVAEQIARHLFEYYYADFAMVLFTSDVEVLRPEKF